MVHFFYKSVKCKSTVTHILMPTRDVGMRVCKSMWKGLEVEGKLLTGFNDCLPPVFCVLRAAFWNIYAT